MFCSGIAGRKAVSLAFTWGESWDILWYCIYHVYIYITVDLGTRCWKVINNVYLYAHMYISAHLLWLAFLCVSGQRCFMGGPPRKPFLYGHSPSHSLIFGPLLEFRNLFRQSFAVFTLASLGCEYQPVSAQCRMQINCVLMEDDAPKLV